MINSHNPKELNETFWTRNFALITGVSLFTSLGFQMLLPTLPVYAKQLGGGDTSAGLVIGVFTLSAVLIRPFVGNALDRYGRRALLLIGILSFAGCVLFYTWAASLAALLFIRFIHGFSWGMTSTSTNTVATDVIPKSRISEGMGYYGLANTFSMALAPALGLWVLNHYGFSNMFITSVTFCIAALILALPIRYQTAGEEKRQFAILEKTALRATVVIFLTAMTYGAVVSFIALYAAERGIENIGSFFSVYAVFLAIIRPLAGKLSDKLGFDYVIIPGLIFIFLAMLCLFWAKQIEVFLLAAAIYGVGFGMVSPSLQALSVIDTESSRRGMANATFFTGFDLGIGTSSVIWGAVSQVAGYSLMFLFASLPCLFALTAYIYGRR